MFAKWKRDVCSGFDLLAGLYCWRKFVIGLGRCGTEDETLRDRKVIKENNNNAESARGIYIHIQPLFEYNRNNNCENLRRNTGRLSLEGPFDPVPAVDMLALFSVGKELVQDKIDGCADFERADDGQRIEIIMEQEKEKEKRQRVDRDTQSTHDSISYNMFAP
jgi:hypothetical protein